MIQKAENLDLQMDPSTNAKEKNALDTKQALDKLHNSWSLLWLLPNPRELAKDASLSNSVAIRVEQKPPYHPNNLNWKNGVLADSYKIEEVLTPAAASV